jgi:SSS family solute:Na+ symporter
MWVIGVPAVATLLLLFPLARFIRLLSGTTLSDLMEERYGKSARLLTTFLIVWYMMVLAASQMVAAGTFLGGFLKISYPLSLALVSGIVVLYSGAGGFLSVVRTHGLQAILLLTGVGGLVISLSRRAGWADLERISAATNREGFLNFFAHGERNVLIALSFVLAWTISPIAWQRIQAARTLVSARRGLFSAALFLGIFYVAIVAAGMLFLPLFPESSPDHPLISEYLLSEAGGFFGAVLFLAVLAAVLSTLDAALNAGAFSLTQDILRGVRRVGNGAGSLKWGRISTLILGVGAFLVASRFQDILRTLGLASKIMAEGLFIPGVAAIFMRRKAPLAGLLSLGAGGGYAFLCFLEETGVLPLGLPLWPASLLTGLAASGTGFLFGWVVERLRRKKREGMP